tara:strand:+ start:536 stop:715 length:180 start_codon:yes stop_codon:yes gene_type:complete
MLDNAVKSNVIVNGSITIGVYFIFWIVVTIILPAISLGLKLFLKESQIISDHTQETLQE